MTVLTEDSRYQLQVDTKVEYLKEHSAPDEQRFVFAYTVTIINTGLVAAKLLSRYWLITDAQNQKEEVRGEGVVGQQPHLQPQQGYEYTSAAVLKTPVGVMQGAYQLIADDETEFEASIAPFTLAVPGILN